MECPWRHKLKYLDAIKTKNDGPSVHTEFGQVIHDALEQYLQTRQMPELESVQVNLRSAFAQIDPPNPTENTEQQWVPAIQPILSAVPKFLVDTFGENWKFVASELPLLEHISDRHKDMKFKGYVDGVIVDEKTGKTWLLDWKTASFFWPLEKRTDPKKTFQLVYYKHFYSEKYKIPLTDLRCAFVLLVKPRPNSKGIWSGDTSKICHLVPVSVGDKAVSKAMDTIDSMSAHVKKNMFPKDRSSCKFCPYANTEHCT